MAISLRSLWLLTLATGASLPYFALSETAMREAAARAPINVLSARLGAEAESELRAGDPLAATQLFESALVADPANAAAYAGLGEAALALHLPGQALAHFDRALAFDRQDRRALAGEAIAFADRGVPAMARQSLAALLRVCGGGPCDEAQRVRMRLNRRERRAAIDPADLTPRPVVEPAPASEN